MNSPHILDLKSEVPHWNRGLMSDAEVEKLESLLNCKNRAVNKWIEEKEDHFNKLTQKLYNNAEKRINKSKHIGSERVLESLNGSDTDNSQRLSLQSSATDKDSKINEN